MKQQRILRFGIIAVLLVLGVSWALASAGDPAAAGYPNGRFLVTAQWLQQHAKDPGLVIVDVREDKYLGDVFIPGAVHLEWKQFQETDTARGIGGAFIGIDRSQEILGKAGVTRTDTVILYDNLKRDGAATSSYVFWVLDLLGHADMKVLERGIEAWTDAGYETAPSPKGCRACAVSGTDRGTASGTAGGWRVCPVASWGPVLPDLGRAFSG